MSRRIIIEIHNGVPLRQGVEAALALINEGSCENGFRRVTPCPKYGVRILAKRSRYKTRYESSATFNVIPTAQMDIEEVAGVIML